MKDKFLLEFGEKMNLTQDAELIQNLELEAISIDTTGGISGNVTDEKGEVISDATIKIFDLNFNPIKHTMSLADGSYSITGIAPGNYLVYAIKDGYQLSQKMTVAVDVSVEKIHPIVLKTDAVITLGMIYGHTKDSNNLILPRVKVSLYRKNGEVLELINQTISADDGEYVIYGIQTGNYVLRANNDDYVLLKDIEVIINNSVPVREVLFLSRILANKEGTINGVIINKITKAPISGAFVGLYSIDEVNQETLIAGTLSDREGKYFFGLVPSGNYIVKAKMTD